MTAETRTTYYLSKYALSSKGRIVAFKSDRKAETGDYAKLGLGFYTVGKEAHTTPEAAIAAAEAARVKKIASLKKQIAALEKMTFTVEPVHD